MKVQRKFNGKYPGEIPTEQLKGLLGNSTKKCENYNQIP